MTLFLSALPSAEVSLSEEETAAEEAAVKEVSSGESPVRAENAASAKADSADDGADFTSGQKTARTERGTSVQTMGDATVALLGGFDTNARRVIGETSVTDAFASLNAMARGSLLIGESHLLSGRYDLGLKKFYDMAPEDLIVQQLALSYAPSIGAWSFAVDTRGKLRISRNGIRDYLDLHGDVAAIRSLPGGWSLRLEAGVRNFRYPRQPAYGFIDGHVSLFGSWKITRAVRLTLGLQGFLPYYEGNARLPDATYDTERRRHDKTLAAQLKISWRHSWSQTAIALQAGYLWVGNWSNSFGESFGRHRIFGAVAARLPWSIFVGLHVAWQTIHYPDGLFLSDELIDLMLYDDESQSSSMLKLSRPIIQDHLDVELRYKLSWVDLPRRYDDTSLNYLRQVGTIGLAGRF